MATARAEAENIYGSKLLEIRQSFGPRKDGFNHDEGATVRKAYEGIVNEMGEEGKHHLQVSENIRVMVLMPFRNWAEKHKTRVDYSSDFLRAKVKLYEREGQEVQKLQRKYFNKCRLLDEARDAEEQDTDTEKQPEETVPLDSPKVEPQPEPEFSDDDDDEPLELADITYSAQQLKALLLQMLTEIPQREVKVPIMGTYDHVCIGSDIVTWLQENVTSGNMSVAEHFGQDLASNGFLRLVGQVGNKFANSSVLHYQWKKLAFERAKLERSAQRENSFTPFVGEYLSGTINNYLNNPHPDETPIQRLQREVTELDNKYRQSVVKFDDARCILEESIIEHLSFMEKCESDRLHAIKHVFLDFLASLSNVVPSIQASVDKYLLYQETVVPERDMLYLVETYKTGSFSPRVPVYDNYYSPAEGWTFGVDLELRCRGDQRRVPWIISTTLVHLDNVYPVLENDKVRLGVWTVEAPLKKTHELRKKINNGLPVTEEILQEYDPDVVASMIKLYLRELPDSVVPSMYYDSIKMIYADHGSDADSKIRIRQIQATFGQMRMSQIAVLDALTRHLSRLMEIARPGQEYRDNLAKELGPCILRPRVQTVVTMSDRHPQRLVRDLLENRKAIISEVKRHNSIGEGSSRVSSRRSASGASGPYGANGIGSGSSTISLDDTALYRAPLQRVGPARLDPGALKPRGPKRDPAPFKANNAPRQGVELTDGPTMSVSPPLLPQSGGEVPSTSNLAPSSPGGARHGQVLTDLPSTAVSPKFNGDGGYKPTEVIQVDLDSDDEPSITHIQATPSLR